MTDHKYAVQIHQYLLKKQPKQVYYHASVYYDELKLTCWSIKALRGLITTAIESLLTANGGRNMQRDFPDPVAILTNTSLRCSKGNITSICPGLKPANLKYFWRVFSRRVLAGQCKSLQSELAHMAFSWSIMHAA